jgi:signal transduction histidine kinase
MKVSLKDVGAALFAAAALLAGFVCVGTDRVDPGLHLTYVDGQVVIASVDFGSAGARDGLVPGLIIVTLDGEDILAAPAEHKRAVAAEPWRWSGLSVIEPSHLADELTARAQSALSVQPYYAFDTYWYGIPDHSSDLAPMGFGMAILLIGWWWLGTGRGGTGLRRYALTLPLATAMPLLILPLDRMPTFAATVTESLLLAGAMVPLGLDFAEQQADPRARRRLSIGVLCLAGVTAVVGLVPVGLSASPGSVTVAGFPLLILRAALAGSIAFVPGFLASRPVDWRATAVISSGQRSRMLESTQLMLPAMTPGVACVGMIMPNQAFLLPIAVWLVVIGVLRLSLRSVVGLLTRAERQRDLVVAATEAERARIAADIHDDALQDLTMLVRRLDATGNAADAEAARHVAGRLRAICGDLRLPILDDLGVGPALEWLCSRYQAEALGISLDRSGEEERLPARVELAFFRVAQEALANAVRHGAPPIRLRYRAGGGWAELDVDDNGRGLPANAAEGSEQVGHMGLLNMSQRAEAVGADLIIAGRPGGGTRVSLDWEAAVGLPHVSVPSGKPEAAQ